MERRVLVVAVILSVLVAGCGGASSGGPSTSTTGSSTTATQTTHDVHGTLVVHFIDVGQSSSTLVVSPSGKTMLVDSGNFKDGGKYVLAYLERHHIDRIDYLVSTHADADHIGGNAAIIEYYETKANGVGAVYDSGIPSNTAVYQRYLDAVEKYDVPLYDTQSGDTIDMGSNVSTHVLAPPRPYLASEERNANSIVVRLTFGGTSFVLPGDADAPEESYLVDTYGSSLQSTVLLAGHHGSKTSSGDEFLDAVKPKVAIISSAYDSQYGHPNEETLQRLADRNIRAYWTGTHGDVVVTSDGRKLTIATQRAAPTDPLKLRSGTEIPLGSTDPVKPRATIATDGTAKPIVADGGTSTGNGTGSADNASGESSLSLVSVTADPAGDDRENLTGESVTLKNTGDRSIDLSGWHLRDESGRAYAFPDGFVLRSGATVTVHTGSGSDTDTDLYWGSGAPIWNNDGDTVTVTNADGKTVLREQYQ